MLKRAFVVTYQAGRRIVIAVVGATIVLLGVIMLVAPGPAIVVIPIGLAILGLEFAFARRWLQKLRETISRKGAANRAARAERHRD